MSLVDDVLKNAEKTVVSNVQSLHQQGLKKFIQDSGLDVNGMTQEALNTAYENFKKTNLDKVVNGEYLGDQARQFSELITYSADEIKKQASQISISGVNAQELLSSPEAVLHRTAENMVDKEIDKVVQSKVGDILKRNGAIKSDAQADEVKELIRNTIRGTRNSIFRDSSIKEGLVKTAEETLNNYYRSAIEMLESPQWQKKQLKPLNDMMTKQFDRLDDATGKLSNEFEKINGQIDRYANKLSELEKLDIAKEISSQVTDKLGISGRLNSLNKQLGRFGLGQVTLDSIDNSLNASITNTINTALGPTIQDSINSLGNINKEVAHVQEYVRQYEAYIQKEIKAFEDKAKEYIQQVEAELINTVLSSVHLKLGSSIKLSF